jgi:hypothetical protein
MTNRAPTLNRINPRNLFNPLNLFNLFNPLNPTVTGDETPAVSLT